MALCFQPLVFSPQSFGRSVFGGPFGAVRCRLIILEPGHILAVPNVRGGSQARVVVQRCHPQDDMRLPRPFGHQVAATARAKVPLLSGRGFETRQMLAARQPAEMAPSDTRRRCKGRSVRLAAGPAVALLDRHVELIDLIANSPAQAGAFQGLSHLRLAPHPRAIGVKQRLGDQARRAALAQNFDLYG